METMICESLWVFTKRPVEVRADELVRAAVVACEPDKVRVVEEYFSEGVLRVLLEVTSKGRCSEYLSPLLKYLLGNEVKIISSSCGSSPLS